MADWKVSAERIEIFEHPNADAMEIAKVGMFSLVVARANGYKSGDVVVFAPKRSILPEGLRGMYVNAETGISYLVGPDNDRVSSIRLRGELSEGVTIAVSYVLEKLGLASVDDLMIGEDISARLGITRYEPPLPASFGGELAHMSITHYAMHDVEQMAIYAGEFTPGEMVIATEKIHGSQCALLIDDAGVPHVSSKGFFDKGIEIREDERNIYWRAVRNTALVDLLSAAFSGTLVQAFGEAFPAQGGQWSYGNDGNHPTMRVFRVIVDGRELSMGEVKAAVPALTDLWVPVLYEGPFDLGILRPLAKGREQVSGKSLHKREGLVVTPVTPRRAREGFNLALKIVAPDFKDSDEAFS